MQKKRRGDSLNIRQFPGSRSLRIRVRSRFVKDLRRGLLFKHMVSTLKRKQLSAQDSAQTCRHIHAGF